LHFTFLVAFVAMSLMLFGVAASTLWWMLHAWRTPDVLQTTGFTTGRDNPQLSFSLLVPARHEQAVLGDTVDRLARLDHPDFEVVVIIGHDDPETGAVAEAAADRWPGRVRVVIDHNVPKNKPKALNTALAECRGDVVGVFDAEDEVDRRLLRQVDTCFRRTGAHVVQGGVQLMNFQTSWYSLRNCLEYFFWFRSRLHLHALHRFIPLGGNTVFVRTNVLRDVGGWDPECLAEDCELGVRLSALGAKVAVAYDPELVTREETPDSVRALIKQRTRWNQGFLQVLRKGEWRNLPTRPMRWLARYTLAMPFLQAFTGVAVPVSMACAIWLRVPVVIALISFLPAVPTLATLAFEAAGLREFGRIYYVRPRLRDYARLLLGTFFYQWLLASAALRAVGREALGRRGWEKTAHIGAHRTATAAAEASTRVLRPEEAVPA
jgi:cellulose synthase/poly-beta-1,6-N-acetylglucosamine synthase-like glycosyltransferase